MYNVIRVVDMTDNGGQSLHKPVSSRPGCLVQGYIPTQCSGGEERGSGQWLCQAWTTREINSLRTGACNLLPSPGDADSVETCLLLPHTQALPDVVMDLGTPPHCV